MLSVTMALWCFAFERTTSSQTLNFTELTVASAQSQPDMQMQKELSAHRFQRGTLVAEDVAARPVRLNPNKAFALADITGTRQLMAHVSTTHICYGGESAVSALGTDSVKIERFCFGDVNIVAKVDLNTGMVTIPSQFIAEVQGMKVSLCKMDFHKAMYDPEAVMRGHIYRNSIVIDDGFGFFVTEGPQAGAYLTVGLMEYAALAKVNATTTAKNITFKDNTLTPANRQVTDQVSGSFVYPVGNDRLRIMRVPVVTTYSDLTARLTPDGRVLIDPQPVYFHSLLGDYNIYNMTEKVENGQVKFSMQVLDPIEVAYDSTSKSLAFGSYGIARSNGLIGMYESASIAMTDEITFPRAMTLNLEGDGSASNPWLIKTAADLQALGQDILTNTQYRTSATDADGNTFYCLYVGKHFKIAADIDFADILSTPIGDNLHWFGGALNGDGHTISNFAIENYAYDYCGLFSRLAPSASITNIKFKNAYVTSIGYTVGVLAGRSYATISDVEIIDSRVIASAGYNAGMLVGYSHAPISNVTVTNGYVQSLGYMGGLVGRSYSNITNCHVAARVIQTGKQVFSGGLVGHQTKTAIDDPAPVVSNCSFTGSVQGTGDQVGLGGLFGGFSYSRAENSFANAVVIGVSGIEAYIGGIAGTTYEAALENCYVSGYVRDSESTYCGGIVGHNTKSISGQGAPTTITNCYCSAMLLTKSTSVNRGIAGDDTNITITNSYFDNQIGVVPDGAHGLATEALTGATLPQGFSTDKWVATEGMYPRIKGQENSDASLVSAAAIRLGAGQNVNDVQADFTYAPDSLKWQAIYENGLSEARGYAFTFDKGTARLTYDQYTDTIYVSHGNASKYFFVNIAPVLFPGKGTAEDPWIISTKEDLKKFTEISNNARMTFTGRYFALGADIDCQGDTLVPVCKDKAAKLFFEGNFDGRGHTIDNFKIVGVGFFTEDNVTGTAVPGQVNPKDENSYYYCGLFGNVGPNGVIRNVVIGSKAYIQSFQYGGAIAGGSEGLIENCYNYGTVRGYYSVTGGIVGYLKKDAVVRNCYNNGFICINGNTTGGVVGQAQQALVENCENTGEVSAYWFNPYQKEASQYGAGGVVGYIDRSTVRNVVNSGKVSSYKQVGGIASKVYATAAIPATVEAALNYGLVYSSEEKTSVGSIAGMNTLGTFTNCVADKQIQKIGLVAGGLCDGTKQLPTTELTAGQGTPKEYFADSVWNVAAGQYPQLKYQTVPAQAALNAKAVISFTATDYAMSMTQSAALAQGIDWKVVNGAVFTVANNKLNVMQPSAGCFVDTIVATVGDCTRKLPIAALNPCLTEGEGTATSPYLIYEPTQYIAIARFMKQFDFDYAGYYFKVMNDLDFTGLEFIPMGADGVMFNGSFDGNGKTVKNVTYEALATDKTATARGFFGIIGYDGSVSKLNIASSTISAYQNAGGISGVCYGNITNSTNAATVSTLGTTGAGGITGYAAMGSTLTGCSNSGVITAKTNYAGGIIGSAPAAAAVSVKDCSNAGEIKGASKIGGIVGSGSVYLTNCHNTGKVNSTNTYAGGILGEALLPSGVAQSDNKGEVTATNQYTAGIVAMSVAHNDEHPFIVKDCHNTVDMTSGVKGYAAGIGAQIKAGAQFIDCTNTGNINGDLAKTTHMRLAGVVSDLTSSASAPSSVLRCSNTGNILCWSNSGGVIGASSGDSLKVVDTWNTGNVEGGYTTATNVAGILGNGPAQFINCWNAGNIKGAGKQVAGINGQNTARSLTFDGCVNVGNITAGVSDAGGMIGMGRATMTNCYNMGTITAPKAAGGLIGEPGNAAASTYTVKVYDCYNSGKVIADTNFGNIMGKNASCKFLETGRLYANTDTLALTDYDNELKVSGMNTAALTQLNITDAFLLQPATLPVLKVFKDNELLNFYAATVLAAEGESLQAVKTQLTIGLPTGAVWTVNGPMTIASSIVVNKAPEDNTPATLTLTCGGLTRTYTLNLLKASGVDSVDADANILRVEYYRMDGTPTTLGDNAEVLIERTIYTDGRSTTRKIVTRK